jgi:Putative transposase DNA-binding domain
MFSRTSLVGHVIHVHLAEASLSAIASFMRGTFVFDSASHTVGLGKLPAIHLPAGLQIEEGSTLSFALVAPDGSVRTQTRTGAVVRSKDGWLRIIGKSMSEPKHKAEDGWTIRVYRFRAYMKHAGIEADEALPQWLTDSITRQRLFWNKLSYLCREARRACSDVPVEVIQNFIAETVRPSIDAFNYSLGRSKGKLTYPKVLKTDEPKIEGLWSFIGELKKRAEGGKLNPPALEETIRAFATQFKTDITPVTNFQRDFSRLAHDATEEFGLRNWEFVSQKNSFEAVLKRRRKLKMNFTDGWPSLKYPDQPGYDNWNISYYLNSADIKIANLNERGISSLRLGEPVLPASSGHPLMNKRRARTRKLRPALITIGDKETRSRFDLRFGVLQSRQLPEWGWLKEWKLIHKGGKFWLCLIVQVRQPKADSNQAAAGVDIGWRRTETGIKIATVYDPTRKQSKEIQLDLDSAPTDTKVREPFVIRMGPNRAWRRHPILSTLEGDNVFDALSALQHKQDAAKDVLKIKIQDILGEETPVWLKKAGRSGLKKLEELFPQHSPELTAAIEQWQKTDTEYKATYGPARKKLAGRLEKGYEMVARDLCGWLAGHVGRIVIEEPFLKKSAEQVSTDDSVSLRRATKYRQIAALGVFLTKLQNVAPSYGLQLEKLPGANTTTTCYHCGFPNPSSEKLKNFCGGCGKLINQDVNAAANLSSLGAGVSLASGT